jgi:hypothetical protein
MNCAGGWHACFCAGRTGSSPAEGGRYRYGSNDHLQFNEYFHGETGAGLGASHLSGWTGLITLLLQPRDPDNPCLLDIAALRTEALPSPR